MPGAVRKPEGAEGVIAGLNAKKNAPGGQPKAFRVRGGNLRFPVCFRFKVCRRLRLVLRVLANLGWQMLGFNLIGWDN